MSLASKSCPADAPYPVPEAAPHAVDRGEIRLVESTAMLAEVQPEHDGDFGPHALTRETVRALLEAPSTELVDVSTVVARKAGDLRVKHRMSSWDAVHLATAILAKVDVLIVCDGKFRRAGTRACTCPVRSTSTICRSYKACSRFVDSGDAPEHAADSESAIMPMRGRWTSATRGRQTPRPTNPHSGASRTPDPPTVHK